MAKILKEITVITGTYVNAQAQQKNRYQRIGSIISTKNGEMLKIDVIPLKEGGWDGWAYINEPRENTDEQPRQNRSRSVVDLDDDVPF
jgi:hypothetical protein